MTSLVSCGMSEVVVFSASTRRTAIVDGATVILDDRSRAFCRELASSEDVTGKVQVVDVERFVVSPMKSCPHAASVIVIEPSRVGCAGDPGKRELETGGTIVIVHDVELLKPYPVSKRWILGGRIPQTRT